MRDTSGASESNKEIAGWDNRTDAYSEAGTNDAGVSISATLTTSYNDAIKAVDPCGSENEDDPSGIGEYTIPDVILGQSGSAREGVELLGSIIDKFGAYDCNQIMISDENEVWNFQMLSGHQWIAIKLPSDVASVNPNMGNLQYKVDLSDSDSCIHSAGIEDVAKKADHYVTFDDGSMNVAKSYGEENSGSGQNTRYAQGRAYFSAALTAGTDYTVDDNGVVTGIADPELFFTPGDKSLTTFTVLRSTAARGEQDESLNANLNSNLYAIGNNRTVESHMFQIRDEYADQPDIATLQWEALSRAEFSIFVPSYSALLTEVDPVYGDINSFPEGHGSDSRKADVTEAALEATDDSDDYLDYIFMDINTLCYNNRKSTASGTREYLDALQNEIIEQQATVDAKMAATPESKRTELANKAHAEVTEEVYAKAKTLLTELRAYVKAGDTSKPFAPSDLKNGKLVEPLKYAETVDSAVTTFVDVEEGDTTNHADDVQWLADNGITTGWKLEDGTSEFRGMSEIKRADMAAFLYRAAGKPEVTDEMVEKAEATCKDVKGLEDHHDEVCWLIASGISTGFDDGTFRPYDTVARQDMAAFLHRLSDYKEWKLDGKTELAFADVTDGDETNHADDVQWLAANAISTGWKLDDGTSEFRGQESVKRQDMAAFIHRLFVAANAEVASE